MECIRNNKLQTHVIIWMTLTHIMLSSRSQTQVSTLYESIYIKCQTGKTNLWDRSQDSWDSCQWQVVSGGRHTWDSGNDLYFEC